MAPCVYIFRQFRTNVVTAEHQINLQAKIVSAFFIFFVQILLYKNVDPLVLVNSNEGSKLDKIASTR